MFELSIAFGAGLISFLSPCVLPLIPGYISFISGSTLNELLAKKKIKVDNGLKENLGIHLDHLGHTWLQVMRSKIYKI